MSNLPPSGEIPRGAIRFNTDSNKPELWDGSQWAEFQLSTPNLGVGADTEPGTRGLFAGGYQPGAYQNDIDYINIASRGNSQDFGILNRAPTAGGGVGSRTRALFAGGYTSSGGKPPEIDTVVFSSTGDATDFGDLNNGTNIRRAAAGNETRGLFAGGGDPTSATQIDFVTIAATGESNDFGDLTVARSRFSGAGSATRSIFAGGFTGPSGGNIFRDTIDFVNTPTLGTANDFGDLTSGKSWTGSCSNATRMLTGGGVNSPGGDGTALSQVDYITISTTGNASDFGDLNKVVDTGAYAGSGLASPTRGVFNTGIFKNPSTTYMNTIYFVEISTQGQASDFGDLDGKRYGVQTASNGHGGL